jgi:hypothetical protein
VLALAARLTALDRSYDVFVDELYYSGVAHNLADGHGLTVQGAPFALHPPALFALLATVLSVTGGHDGQPLARVLALRPVVAVTGTVLVVAVTALLLRTVRRPAAAWAAGLLLAADPFLNRFDSRVLLETQATAASALGLLVLTARPATVRGRAAVGVGSGLLFAVSVTTKDWYVLLSLAPVVTLALLATGPARRVLSTAAAVTAAGYGLYDAAVAATGGWPAWWAQKSDGLIRVIGLRVTTGVHRPGATGGFVDRLLANQQQLTVTYLLIVAGGCASCWLLWRLRGRHGRFTDIPGRVLVALWPLFALPALLYAVLWGSCEEQMFYPLPVTGTAALAVAADLLVPRGRPVPAALVAAAVCAALTADTVVWTQVHTRHDDAYRRMVAWTDRHVPTDARVAVTEETPTFYFAHPVKGSWESRAQLARSHVDYLLLSTAQVAAQGAAAIGPRLLSDIRSTLRPVHSERGVTNGDLLLYRLGQATTGHGPRR